MDVRMIAHDMRTPLNALLLSVQAAASTAPDDQKVMLQLAENNARVLSGMIESLLATTEQIPSARSALALRPCVAADLVKSAVDQIAPQATSKSLIVEIRPIAHLPTFVADGERLVRVLVNLLTNAVKFTPEGGHIAVEVKYRLNDGHPTVIFSVIDDGIGVSEQDAQRIFVEGISIASPGNCSHGLGLAVCKELVEAHGGRIWVELNHTAGSVFSFSIPSAKQVE
jgi:signal transduction histidine kinase